LNFSSGCQVGQMAVEETVLGETFEEDIVGIRLKLQSHFVENQMLCLVLRKGLAIP